MKFSDIVLTDRHAIVTRPDDTSVRYETKIGDRVVTMNKAWSFRDVMSSKIDHESLICSELLMQRDMLVSADLALQKIDRWVRMLKLNHPTKRELIISVDRSTYHDIKYYFNTIIGYIDVSDDKFMGYDLIIAMNKEKYINVSVKEDIHNGRFI